MGEKRRTPPTPPAPKTNAPATEAEADGAQLLDLRVSLDGLYESLEDRLGHGLAVLCDPWAEGCRDFGALDPLLDQGWLGVGGLRDDGFQELVWGETSEGQSK